MDSPPDCQQFLSMNRCDVLYVRYIRCLAISWPDTVFASRASHVVRMNLYEHFNITVEAMNMRW